MKQNFDVLHPLLCMQLLFIGYTLYVMHCEMNLAKNFLITIFGNKDIVKVIRD
jgi:hypothetical protein